MSPVERSAGGGGGTTAVTLLYDFTISVAQASVDTNVDGALAGLFPTSYRVLEVWAMMRSDEAVASSSINMTVNNDTGANYDRAFIATSIGGAPIQGTGVAQTSWSLGCPGSTATASNPGVLRMSFPAYADATFFKVAEDFGGFQPGTATLGNYQVLAQTFTYRSTSALTRMKWTPATGGAKLIAGCRFMVWART